MAATMDVDVLMQLPFQPIVFEDGRDDDIQLPLAQNPEVAEFIETVRFVPIPEDGPQFLRVDVKKDGGLEVDHIEVYNVERLKQGLSHHNIYVVHDLREVSV